MAYRRRFRLGEVARDPVRRIGYASFRGYYGSVLNRCRYPFESLLERDAMMIHDFDLGVRRFQAQPVTIGYVRQGRRRRYTPDLLVELMGGASVFLEVRPAERTPGRLGPLLPWIQEACLEHGAPHHFMDERTIRAEPAHTNGRWLRAAPRHLDDDVVAAAARVLLDIGLPAALGDLEAAMAGPIRRPAFLGLAALRILRLPIGLPITGDTVMAKGELW